MGLILNSYFCGCYFNKEFCQLPAQYLFCNLLQLQVISRSPLLFVDLCQMHFSLNCSFQVIESDHFFTLVFSFYNFSFKEDTGHFYGPVGGQFLLSPSCMVRNTSSTRALVFSVTSGTFFAFDNGEQQWQLDLYQPVQKGNSPLRQHGSKWKIQRVLLRCFPSNMKV